MTGRRKFLVAGALGHIGSRLVRAMAEHYPGCDVTMVDDLSTQRFPSLFDLPKSASYRFVEAAIADLDLGPLVAGCDAVIQLAALTDAAGSFARREMVEQNNYGATDRIAVACADAGVPMFYPSSTSVYGPQSNVVDEDCGPEDLRPQSPYAETKLKEEDRIRELVRTHGLKAVVARLGTIFGVSPGMRFHTAVNKFCWQAATGQDLTVWRSAYEQKRPYLDLEDACRAIMYFIDTRLWDGRTYNIVTSNHTVRGVIDCIRSRVPDLSLKFVDVPIMNQLSYEVRNKQLDALEFGFAGDLDRGIATTLSLLGIRSGESRPRSIKR